MKNFSFAPRLLPLIWAALLLPLTAHTQVTGWASMNGGTTGGAGGQEVVVTNATELTNAIANTAAMVIKISGMISADITISRADKTIEGLAAGAGINGTIRINNTRNIILRNLVLQPNQARGADDVVEVSGSTNVWITHCDVSDHRQTLDGLIDIVRASNYVTVSWTKLWYPSSNPSHRLAMLIGNGDAATGDRGNLKVSLHHNWWGQNIQERMPRARFGEIHVYNSYFNVPNNNYCIGPGLEAKVVVESNSFEGVRNPHIFYNNETSAQIRINSDNQYVNTSGNRHTGQGNAFTVPYAYTLDRGTDVKSLVMASAGPQFGAAPPPPPPPPTQVFRGNGTFFDSLIVYEVANAENWNIRTHLAVGNTVYGDRTFTFSSVPAALESAEWVSTAMNSRTNSSLDRYASVIVTRAGYLYVAHSDRVTAKPQWLSTYESTDLSITVEENATTWRTLTLYRRAISPGDRINIGINSNDGTTQSLMYLLAFTPADAPVPVLGSPHTASPSHIVVYDLRGNFVRKISSDAIGMGNPNRTLEASGLKPGVYHIRMEVGSQVLARSVFIP